MHTLLSDAPSAPNPRLQDYARLTHDTRVAFADRLALRLGLWLLLSGARRAERRADRVARECRALARETYARREREAAVTRAALTSHYR